MKKSSKNYESNETPNIGYLLGEGQKPKKKQENSEKQYSMKRMPSPEP